MNVKVMLSLGRIYFELGKNQAEVCFCKRKTI